MKVLPVDEWLDPKYDFVHWTLGALYIAMMITSLAVLLRFLKRHAWVITLNAWWQLIFHPLLMLGCAVRAGFFILAPFLREGSVVMSNKWNMILNASPSFLFFSDYLIILFLWAEIYHNTQDEGLGISKLRPTFVAINLIMYCVVALLYVLDFVLFPEHQYENVAHTVDTIQKIVMTIDVGTYLMTSLAFLVYGSRIYLKFSAIPIYSKKRQEILRKIQAITCLVALCFLTRVIIVYLGAFKWNMSKLWWFDGTYYVCLELLPIALMLHLLHGDHKKAAGASGGNINSYSYKRQSSDSAN